MYGGYLVASWANFSNVSNIDAANNSVFVDTRIENSNVTNSTIFKSEANGSSFW